MLLYRLKYRLLKVVLPRYPAGLYVELVIFLNVRQSGWGRVHQKAGLRVERLTITILISI
jgi:hypothetical protein